MTDLSSVSLLDLLPSSLREDAAVHAAAQAIDTQLQAVTAEIARICYVNRLDSLSSEETDELAWQYHVDFYDPTLPLDQRRQLIKSSFGWHRRKGTPAAVEELINTIFGSGQVLEWFEYGGQPGYFKVTTSDPSANSSKAAEFIAAINSVKNARSWLEAIEITSGGQVDIYVGGAIYIGDFITVKQVT